MSYYANAEGLITLKEGVDKDNIFSLLDDYIVKEEPNISFEMFDNKVILTGNGNYRDDDIRKFLGLLAPFTEVGNLNYDGEDSNWQFRFNPETSLFEELNGKIVYEGHEFEDFSDEMLASELGKRGYLVEKLV